LLTLLRQNSERQAWERTGDLITAVTQESALLQLPDSVEEKIPQNGSDHSTIVKFDSKQHAGYTSARDRLKKFEKNAPSVVAARFCA
jgi:hypothetical protein